MLMDNKMNVHYYGKEEYKRNLTKDIFVLEMIDDHPTEDRSQGTSRYITNLALIMIKTTPYI